MIPGTVNNAASSGAAAGGTQKTVFITSTGSFTIPGDFVSLVSIEGIGAGADGTASTYVVLFGGTNGTGGGGGAYSKVTSLSGLSAGGTLYCQVGAPGGSADTWVNKTSNAAPASVSDGILAKGASGRNGGSAGSGYGSVKNDGGNASIVAGAGGGGAGGPSGQGNNSSSSGGAGASGNAGLSGGGSGGTYPAGAGGAGSYWVQTSNSATAGPGGGGGSGMPGGAGGNYGAGGGSGRYSGSTTAAGGAGKGGIIIFTYLA